MVHPDHTTEVGGECEQSNSSTSTRGKLEQLDSVVEAKYRALEQAIDRSEGDIKNLWNEWQDARDAFDTAWLEQRPLLGTEGERKAVGQLSQLAFAFRSLAAATSRDHLHAAAEITHALAYGLAVFAKDPELLNALSRIAHKQMSSNRYEGARDAAGDWVSGGPIFSGNRSDELTYLRDVVAKTVIESYPDQASPIMSTRLADALVNEIGFNCIEIRAAIPWKGGGDRRKAILTAANLEAVAVSLQPILEAHADWRTAEAGTAIVRAALRALGLPEAQAKGSFDFERQREKRTENKRPPT